MREQVLSLPGLKARVSRAKRMNLIDESKTISYNFNSFTLEREQLKPLVDCHFFFASPVDKMERFKRPVIWQRINGLGESPLEEEGFTHEFN